MNTEESKTNQTKKTWETPQLRVYGDVEKITGEWVKIPGASDGANHNGVPTAWRS